MKNSKKEQLNWATNLLKNGKTKEARLLFLNVLEKELEEESKDRAEIFLSISEVPNIDERIRNIALDALVYFDHFGDKSYNQKTSRTLLLDSLKKARAATI